MRHNPSPTLPLAIAIVLAHALPLAAQDLPAAASLRCAESAAGATTPSRDLYCLDLVPVPDHRQASGIVELGTVPSPFGIALTADGRHVYDLSVTLRELPRPQSLGPYTTYIAWAAPPMLQPMVRLGAVANGRTRLGHVALNKFLIFISAERSADVTERTGPLMLRGTSPSMRMGDIHFLGAGSGAAHDHAEGADGELRWTMPPMDPRVLPLPMPGIDDAVPNATPYLPGRDIDPASIPAVQPRRLHRLRDGDTLRLEAGLVRRSLKGRDLVMFAFNGQHPGPLIQVDQASSVFVDFHNRTDWPTAVHWHGIRLDNRFDGVPHVTQDPVAPGGRFLYHVRFPDAGIYWYHPHHREDVQQDLGLYGNLLVRSNDPAYFGPAHREEVLMLDDLLLGESRLVPFGLEHATHAVMGRFGNVLLVNGEPHYELKVKRGELVRFQLTNAANTRTFNLSFTNARMKVLATDVSRFQREEWVESAVIAPAERYVVDVRFDSTGDAYVLNRVQALDHGADRFFAVEDTLGVVRVSAEAATPSLEASFTALRHHRQVSAEIESLRSHFDRPADLELILTLQNRSLSYALERLLLLDAPYFNPVEWAGTMPMMDWLPTAREVRWVLRDVLTGLENDAIDWRFRRGDLVRLRLHNDRAALHAMQHPMHIHGQRFLVLAVNGVSNRNLAWKDTVLVPVGATVDILLEISNPGRWMIHCHIAEHLEAGMKAIFSVQ